jgi:hypothetical protein
MSTPADLDDVLRKTDLFDHVGPVDPYRGGSGITIVLDADCGYVTHVTETLAAAPDFSDEEAR